MSSIVSSMRDRFTARSAPGPGPRTPDLQDQVVFDEELLARLRRLTLLSNRAISQGLAGEHRSRRRGSSPEFADFKSYSQGDDFRRIDWNIYSRLGELFVRLSEVTTELTVHMLLDASASMRWSGDPARVTKFTYARRVAGSLGYVSLWHFDRLTITPFAEQLGQPFGPSHGRSNITPMLKFLTDLPATGETSVAESIERYARARRRPGILIVLSDLLSGEPEEMRTALQVLRSRGWQTTVVQIVDPAESDPANAFPAGPGGQALTIELVDLENAGRLRVTPNQAALQDYDRAYRAWQSDVEAVCESEQIPLVTLQTDWPFETVVLGLLSQRGVVG
jgi:uncharacterized protein (DUF58 family)